MSRPGTLSFFPAVLLLLSAALTGCRSSSPGYNRIEGFAQGGTYHIIHNLPEGVCPEDVAASVDSLLTAIDNSLSGYNKGSILSRVNRGENPLLDDLFTGCFLSSKRLWAESDGAFDPSAAPFFDLWGFGFESGLAVEQSSIDSLWRYVGMEKFSIEETSEGLRLHRQEEGCKLNFNAIAQGFTCDVIAGMLQDKFGIHDYLVEVGREIICSGVSPRGDLWNIGLDKPSDGNMEEGKDLQDIFAVTDRAVVTSGNYRKFYIKEGKKFAHTIDPRTGRPVTHSLLSATVFAPDASTADACATWFMVVGLEKAVKALEDMPELDAYLVYEEEGQMKVWQSEGCNLENKQNQQ